MIRKFVVATLVGAVALVGVAAQAGAYLLAFTTPTPTTAVASGASGMGAVRPVGVSRVDTDEAPIAFNVWYPASAHTDEAAGTSYSYGLNVSGPRSQIALGVSDGSAHRNATPGGTSYPLVVFSHGFAMSVGSYAWLAEHIAAFGMVVVAPEHAETLNPANLWRSTLTRPDDIKTVLEYLESGADEWLSSLVDTRRVAVVGHSYGGYTALAAGGARIDPSQFTESCDHAYATDSLVFLCDALTPNLNELANAPIPTDWLASRVDAVVTLAGDAAMFGSVGLADVEVPVLAIGGTADHDSPFEWGTRLVYDSVSSARKAEIALEGAGHFVFAAECHVARRVLALVPNGFCADPGWNRSDAHRLVSEHVAAFLVTELGVDDLGEVLAPGVDPGPEVAFRSEGY